MSALIDIAIHHRQGDFTLDARFTSQGRLTALFGRSGSGKTSLVNVVAGLIRPQAGHVTIEGEPLLDTARGILVPRHRRRIGYVFQEARLFPHLSVRQNLLFGRWFSPRDAPRSSELAAVLELLGIGHLLQRRPGTLSGGEKQRVAIGRALLANPRLLLMDEPLASLDEERKAEILPFIERLRDETGIPIIYVSHAVGEVARLATTVAVLDKGLVRACGPTSEILARLDMAVLSGAAEASSIVEANVLDIDLQFGLTRLATRAGPLQVTRTGLVPGQKLRVRILASDVLISLAPLAGISALNTLRGEIVEIGARRDGGAVDVRLACNGESLIARLTAKSVSMLDLQVGRTVYAIIKSVSIDAP